MNKNLFLMLLLVIGFISCSEENSNGIQGVPFQERENGKWSMISTDNGEVIFSNEFKTPITMAVEGRFMTKNGKDLWEIYTAEKKPKKIGKEYVWATCFHDGRALVTEPNKPVSIIDKEGQTVKVLDKIDNQIVTGVEDFSEGYAVYKTAGDYCGVINADGKSVIPAKYCNIYNCSDGKFVAIDKKYEKNFRGEDDSDYFFTVLNTSGKKLCDIQRSKYEWIGGFFQSGLLEISVKRNGKECWGLINEKGEEVVRPTEKIQGIEDIQGDKFVYKHDEKYGLMNLKGETLLRPKYDLLILDGDNLMTSIDTGKEEEEYSYSFINEKGEKLFNKEFPEAFTFRYFGGKYTLVMITDNKFALIDKEGKAVEKQPKMWDVNFNTGDSYIQSDSMDIDAFMVALGIIPNGVDGLTFNTPVQKIVAHYAKNSDKGDAEHPGTDPYWYDVMKELNYTKVFNSIPVTISISFPSEISQRIYTAEEIDEENETYEGSSTSYVFNDIKPSSFSFDINLSSVKQNKLIYLYQKICAKFKQMGRIVKENSNATIFTMNNGCTAIIVKDEEGISATWGKNIDLSRFNTVKY